MPVLTTEKILALQEAFNAKGPDANDRVKLEDLVSVVKKAEPTATDEAIQRLLKQYDTENNNALGLDKVLCVVEDL